MKREVTSTRSDLVPTFSVRAATVRPGEQAQRRVWPDAVLAGACFCALAGAYLWFIHHYGVNTPWYDQWWDVRLLEQLHSGHLGLSDLWAQHGEHRIFFPNLLVLLLDKTTRFNIVVEEFVSAAMLMAATALFIVGHRRRSRNVPWLLYVPVAALLLSLVQYQDSLWGFQLAWYMVLLSLAAALFLLDSPRLTWPVFAVAVTAGVIGSYSSLQGLLIWPVGLILIAARRRRIATLACWVGIGIATTFVYYLGYSVQFAGGNLSYGFTHPAIAIEYFLVALGSVFGLTPSIAGNIAVALIGGLILAFCCLMVALTAPRWRRQADETGAPVGVALIAFAVLFVFLMTVGRADSGLAAARTSRYTTFTLLSLVGCYMVILDPFAVALRALSSEFLRPTGTRIAKLLGPRSLEAEGSGSLHASRARWELWASAALLPILGAQFVAGLSIGISQGRGSEEYQQFAARVTANMSNVPTHVRDRALLDTCNCPEMADQLPQLNRFLALHRLSLYGTGAAAAYMRQGYPIAHIAPTVTVVRPKNGAVLSGATFFGSAASGDYPISRVEFVATGEGLHDEVIGTAVHVSFGWLGGWNTMTVPNGAYLVESVAFDEVGNVGRSLPVTVSVRN